MANYLWLVFLLILLYLLLAPGPNGQPNQVKEIINSLSNESVNTIIALQGRGQR